MSDRKTIVAVLDDESKMRVALKRLLAVHGFEVELCASWDECALLIERRCPDCLLLDLHMPDFSGLEILGAMATLPAPVPTVVITGRDEPGTEALVRDLGAVHYLLKPLDESTLVQAIREACEAPAPRGRPIPSIP